MAPTQTFCFDNVSAGSKAIITIRNINAISTKYTGVAPNLNVNTTIPGNIINGMITNGIYRLSFDLIKYHIEKILPPIMNKDLKKDRIYTPNIALVILYVKCKPSNILGQK